MFDFLMQSCPSIETQRAPFFFLNPSVLSTDTSSNTNYNPQRHVYIFCNCVAYFILCCVFVTSLFGL